MVRISRLNHSKRYSQTELSAFLGYKNGQFISNVERGICSIPVKSLKKISDLLGISPEDIKEAVLKDHAQTIDNFFLTINSKAMSLTHQILFIQKMVYYESLLYNGFS